MFCAGYQVAIAWSVENVLQMTSLRGFSNELLGEHFTVLWFLNNFQMENGILL